MTEQAVAAGMATFGLLMAHVHLRELRRELASRFWPRATGRVLRTSMTTAVIGGESRRLGDVEPHVVVAYVVDGAEYHTSRVRWAGVPSWAAVRTLTHYHEGRAVAVAYDPADPGCAVLEPGPTLLSASWVVLGAASLVGGLLWLAFPTHAS